MLLRQRLFFAISLYKNTRTIKDFIFVLIIEFHTWIVSNNISQALDKCMHINEFEFPLQTLFGKPLSSTVSNLKLLFASLT